MPFSSSRIRTAWRAAALAGSVCVLVACADFERGEYWQQAEESGESGGATGELGYALDVHPLLDAGCERCHAAGESAGNTQFLLVSDDAEASYESTVEFIDLDSPGDSRLLAKMAGKGHGGGVIFDESSGEYELVLAWIEQGAPP